MVYRCTKVKKQYSEKGLEMAAKKVLQIPLSLKERVDNNADITRKGNDYWGKFCEKITETYPDVERLLSTESGETLKMAMSLSDFVFASAMQAPPSVLELFTEPNFFTANTNDTPNYKSLLAKQLQQCVDEQQLHKALRLFRLKYMVHIAIDDLVFDASLDCSLGRLSELADALILGAKDWLHSFCKNKWGTPSDSDGIEQTMLVFGMGKLGGKELNFSSDIDLIFSYPESGETVGARRSLNNQQYFVRLAQKLITALNQHTADGFVYRVDMRLRPFGDSGPLVMSFNALEDYYQEQGRDWERYAMLKARLIGDSPFHQRLTDLLRPFVYRRYIDFSVIDSLRRMKMMIAQEVRRKNLVNNIKLGAGGIREVEFIVQVFQMIRGGRIKNLQKRNLLSVLPVLVENDVISEKSATLLASSYRFLRRVENIIQALGDKQTQTLPDNELDKHRLIAILGFDFWETFKVELEQRMLDVHLEFGLLIGQESPNHLAQDQHWQTLWFSDWEDEECIGWVAQVDNSWNDELIWLALKAFRLDVSKRSLGNRGRQVLDKLIPLLLWHLEQEKADHEVLEQLLNVLNRIVTRTAYLELLYENEGALKHLVKLCRASHWIAEHIAKFPILLDELIDPKLLNNPPALTSYQDELRQVMLRIPEDDMELQMDTLRQFKQAQQLRIAAADVAQVLDLTKVSDHLTSLAEAIVGEVVQIAWQQISLRYGIPESSVESGDKGFGVIGYGKLGGIELGYSSDLDLVFVHNSSPEEMTNGEKAVPASQFYGKLAQRIMHLFNTRMSSGMLYELDLRLRPSGNSGLLVVHISTFAHYLENEAWTWEHQALVRARAIFGESELINTFLGIRKSILMRSRISEELREDVVKMRDKMRDHLDKSTEDRSDIKQSTGGLVDIEFLAQFLVLNHSADKPDITNFSDNVRIFQQLSQVDIISESEKQVLIDSYCGLRGKGHRATLQKESNMIPTLEFNELSSSTSDIVRKYLAT